MDLPKIPAYIKQQLKELEAEVNQMKDLKNELKNPSALMENGKKCSAAKIFTPVKCYYHVYPRY